MSIRSGDPKRLQDFWDYHNEFPFATIALLKFLQDHHWVEPNEAYDRWFEAPPLIIVRYERPETIEQAQQQLSRYTPQYHIYGSADEGGAYYEFCYPFQTVLYRALRAFWKPAAEHQRQVVLVRPGPFVLLMHAFTRWQRIRRDTTEPLSVYWWYLTHEEVDSLRIGALARDDGDTTDNTEWLYRLANLPWLSALVDEAGQLRYDWLNHERSVWHQEKERFYEVLVRWLG